MANNEKLGLSRLLTPARDFATDNVWQGWDDYRTGSGWNPTYEVWSSIQQKRYEIGRAWAAIVAANLGAVPKWPRNRFLKFSACGDAASIVQRECAAETDFYREGPLDIATAVTPKSGEQDATVAEDVNLRRNDWRSNKNGND